MSVRKFLILAVSLQLSGCAGGFGNQAALYDQLTDQDVTLAAGNLQQSLESLPDGSTGRWANAGNGHSGSVTPTSTYLSAGGHFCRDYQEDLRLGDQVGQFRHTACRNGEAGWIWL